MGAPKQRWTAEEEAALKAGIAKHGAGKWSAILKDPEFSCVLYSRSNVDLKDKWRNICVMPFGRNFRDRATTTSKKPRKTSKLQNKVKVISVSEDFSEETGDAKPIVFPVEPVLQVAPKILDIPKISDEKIDNMILEAIANSKEPTGSNKTAIAMYIECLGVLPPDFKQDLSERLKRMTESGKLVKVKHNYSIAPISAVLPVEVRLNESSKAKGIDIKQLNKSEIEAELGRMKLMNMDEAAAAAALLVAEAESAMAEAEEAMKLAEAAEANAELARAHAESASLSLRNRNSVKVWAGKTIPEY